MSIITNKYTIPVNNTISSVGSFTVVDIGYVEGVVDADITFTVSGLDNETTVSYFYAVSYDGKNYDEYQNLYIGGLSYKLNTVPDQKFWMKMMVKVSENLLARQITVEDINIELQVDSDAFKCDLLSGCVITTEFGLVNMVPCDNMMDMTQFDYFKKMHAQLINTINVRYGMDVYYIKVEPGQDAKDAILNEYTNLKEVDRKCIKVIVPNNELPDVKPQFSEWGIEFDRFEIIISKYYFEQQFGSLSKPRKHDILFFDKFDRIYKISSVYLDRSLDGDDTHYVVNLIKYDDETIIDLDQDTIIQIENDTLTHDDFFDDIIKDERDDGIIDDDIKSNAEDRLRSYINPKVYIDNQFQYHNCTIVLDGYYNTNGVPYGTKSITYIPVISSVAGGNLGITFWVNPTLADKPIKLSELYIISSGESTTVGFDNDYNSYLLGKTNQYDIDIDGTIYTPVYNDDGSITVPTTISSIDSISAMSFINKTLLFTIGDMSVYFYSDIMRLVAGDDIYESAINTRNNWFGVCINISNEFNYLSISTWDLVDRSDLDYGDRQSTLLSKASNYRVDLPAPIIFTGNPELYGRNILFSNLRIWKLVIPEEKQSRLVGQKYARESQNLLLVDNADLNFNGYKIGDQIST
jgi:hypothetical protein